MATENKTPGTVDTTTRERLGKIFDGDGDGNSLDVLTQRLSAFKALSHSDDESGTDAILAEFGASGKVEREIVREMAARAPLWMPARFAEAHQLVMRSLEVVDRNGARAVNTKLGPLTPIANYLVQLVARFIVRNYQSEAINSIRNLYVRREANAPTLSEERKMLRRARMDADRMMPTLKKNPLGVPTFLLGGAVVSWISSGLSKAVEGTKTQIGVIIATVVFFALIALFTWSVLRGAAVTRRRIHLSCDAPMQALWDTIGAAGKPPKDSARSFALIAIIGTMVAFLILPIGLAFSVFR